MIAQPENGRGGVCSQVCLMLVPRIPSFVRLFPPLKSSLSAEHSGPPECGSEPPCPLFHQGLPSLITPMLLFSGPASSGSTPQAYLTLLRFFAFVHYLCFKGTCPSSLPNQLCHPSVPCANVTSCMDPLSASSS